MESERNTPSSSAPYTGGERGAGGKFRKPPARKPPATPYNRPPVKQSTELHDGGWLSKLVNPAYRLIAGGATKILPSFFSKSAYSVADLSPSNIGDHFEDNRDIEVTPNACNDDKHALKLGMSSSAAEAGLSIIVDRLKDNAENNDLEGDNMRTLCDDSELAKIEHLVKGKQFSWDEYKRLTEILNSRVVDVSDAERENKTPSLASQGEGKGAILNHENPIRSIEGKQEDMDRAILEIPTPRFQSNMREAVVASPADIARAYMGSRISKTGLGSYGITSTVERSGQQSDLLEIKPYISTSSPKSSTCWPGAMVQDQRGYLTPQSQRGRYGLHNFPRTPYSRTIYSKSKAKLTQLQVDSRSLNISSTPFQQSRTPDYGQVISMSNVVDVGNGSVGPIRRIRNKFASEAPSRGSSFLNSAQNAPSQVEKSSVSRDFLPVFEKNLEPGGTSGISNYHSVDRIAQNSEGVAIPTAPSSQTVRKILEQLDRHKPTPKEKAAELKLATTWKKSRSEDTGVIQKESTSLADFAGSNLHKNVYLTEQKFSGERIDDRGNLKGKPQKTDALNAMTKTSSMVTGDGCITDDAAAAPSLNFNNACDSHVKGTDEKGNSREKNTSQLWPVDSRANGEDLTRKRSSQPTLKPLSFKRPDPRVVSSDNGLGFTFPFSASAGLASEPPTPSIIPSLPASGVPQHKEEPAIPAYSFGTSLSAPRLVFSFPSTSSASINDDASDLKFEFGSDKKSRVSFSSVGKDAICY